MSALESEVQLSYSQAFPTTVPDTYEAPSHLSVVADLPAEVMLLGDRLLLQSDQVPRQFDSGATLYSYASGLLVGRLTGRSPDSRLRFSGIYEAEINNASVALVPNTPDGIAETYELVNAQRAEQGLRHLEPLVKTTGMSALDGLARALYRSSKRTEAHICIGYDPRDQDGTGMLTVRNEKENFGIYLV